MDAEEKKINSDSGFSNAEIQIPEKQTSSQRSAFLFVFISFHFLCLAAGEDWLLK